MKWTEKAIQHPEAPPGARTITCGMDDGGTLEAGSAQVNGLYVFQIGYKVREYAFCAECGLKWEDHSDGASAEARAVTAGHEFARRLPRWPTIEEMWDALDRLVPPGRVMVAGFIPKMEHVADADARVLQLQEAAFAAPKPLRKGVKLHGRNASE